MKLSIALVALLSISVDRLRSSRSILTDEVAARFGDTITQTLMKLRDCSSNIGANGASPPSKLKHWVASQGLNGTQKWSSW